jgi:hypothetical protein
MATKVHDMSGRWVPEIVKYPLAAAHRGLKVPRGHIIMDHPDGEVREGFVWCVPEEKPKKASKKASKKAAASKAPIADMSKEVSDGDN